MDRREVESILFDLPRWQEMPIEKVPALVIREIPLQYAESLYEGEQFVMGKSDAAKQLFEFFKSIDDGSRLYYLDGYLKHPDIRDQQPLVVGMEVTGLKLTEAELSQFKRLLGDSVTHVENDGQYFTACWGDPSWSQFLYEAI